MGKVSIITLTFNHEEFIFACIESVVKQSYKNWEMIIVDDDSSDKTYEIALSFATRDKRIKIIRHTVNWGIKKLKESYNQALKKTQGDIIAVLEGDDFWPQNKLEIQSEVFKGKNIVLSYGNWAMTNRSGKTIYTRDYKRFDEKLVNNQPAPFILNLFLTLQFDLGSQTVMIRKKTLLDMGGFKNDKYYPFVDIPTYLHLALKGRFAYIPMVLGYYRRTKKSSWLEFASRSKTMGREEMKECINNFAKTTAKPLLKVPNWNNIEQSQNRYLIKRRFLRVGSIIFNRFLANDT